MVETLVAVLGDERGSYNGFSGVNGDGTLEGYLTKETPGVLV